MFSRLAQLFSDVKGRGIAETARYVRHRLSENYNERRLGIRTGDYIHLEEFGINNPEFHEYGPVPYRGFRVLLKESAAQAHEGVFLDYGCGMGRAIILAATYPFRRVIGVELCPEFIAIAQENLKRVEGTLQCKDIQVLAADATNYEVPDDVTHIHLYNSFAGATLAAVVEKIQQSLLRRQRPLTMLVGNSLDFDSLIQKSGLQSTHRQYRFYPLTTYGIYDCRIAP